MLLSKVSRRLRAEGGFSMVVTMGVMSIMLLTTAASIQATQGDQGAAIDDKNRKVAFAAAEAGLQVYVHKLMDSADYWTQCEVKNPDAVNNVWDLPDPTAANYRTKSAQDPRTWKNLPDGSAAYTIESLPANGATKCDPNRPEQTMIDTPSATFRIRITGQAMRNTGTEAAPRYERRGVPRSLIATFKRRSFLDYIYFTDLEVLDPSTYGSIFANDDPTTENRGRNPSGPNQRTIEEWGQDACGQRTDGFRNWAYLRGEGNRYREDQQFVGTARDSQGRTRNISEQCVEIQFVGTDRVEGPLHTNDSLLICGEPSFGRQPGDAIETSAPGNGSGVSSSYRKSTSCGLSKPNVNFEGQPVQNNNLGTWRYDQPVLDMPKDNTSLADEATPNYTFYGETTIRLDRGGLNVTGRDGTGRQLSNERLSYPASGVIYVADRKDPLQGELCTKTYRAGNPYLSRPGCGIARVSGTYDAGLTIGADSDVLVTGNVVRQAGSPALLGLIAQQYIRVYHPVTGAAPCDRGDANASGSLRDVQIDAALLALNHSFIVDNWGCGTPLGDLTVNGAISQKYRGPVGTGSRGSASSGYSKEYKYDDRLTVRSPPKFLDPVQAAWRVKTFQEQVPGQGEVRR